MFLRRADELGRLLLQRVVALGRGAVGGGDVVGVGLEVDVLRRRRWRGRRAAPWPRPRSWASADIMKPSIGASMESVPCSELISGNGKKSRSARSASGNCWPTNEPSRYMPLFLLHEVLRRLLPGAAERVRLVQRRAARRQVSKTSLTFLLSQDSSPAMQALVEVVAVDAHVEDVERAHGRPAVLVGEADRGQAVLLHLRAEGLELVERLRDLVALLLRTGSCGRRPPRGSCRAGRSTACRPRRWTACLEGVAHVDVVPDVGDVAGQALLGEEAHAVAGEPGEDVVGLALQVVVDLLLEVLWSTVLTWTCTSASAREGVDIGCVGGLRAWRRRRSSRSSPCRRPCAPPPLAGCRRCRCRRR